MTDSRSLPDQLTLVVVSLCPHHGLFIDNEQEGMPGCPVQVDYDGITCAHVDTHPRAFRLVSASADESRRSTEADHG